MKYKYKLSLIIISFFLVMALCVGTSYAIWSFSVSQESTNVVLSDCFEITFSDSHPISLEYAFPMEDSLGVQLTPYEFSVSNVCNHPADFQINLETLNTSTLDSNNIKTDINGNILAVENAESVDSTLDNASSAVMLKEDTLAVNETKNYNLRLWVKEDAVSEEIENKSYASKVTIKATVRKQYDVAMLKKGLYFNKIIKTLASGVSTDYYSENTSITSIERSLTAPSESDNAVDVSDSSSEKSIYAWFDNGKISIYTEADKIYMNVDSSYLFFNIRNLISLDLSFFDTSKVQNMENMFGGMREITNVDLSRFDTSNVTNMSFLFDEMSSLTSLDLSNFNTSKVTNMSYMFNGLNGLENFNLSSFDTSNVTNMSGMFSHCSNLEYLDLSSFDTSKVTNMSSMFNDMQKIKVLDLSGFDTSNVKDMSSMFLRSKNITKLNLSNFDTSNVTNMQSMFNNCSNLEYLDLSSFDTSKVTNMSSMFSDMLKIKVLDLSGFDTSNVNDMNYMFANSANIEVLNINSFDTSKVVDMSLMFQSLEKIDNLDLSHFDTSNLTNMSQMFLGMKNLRTLDISSFDTSKVTDMKALFDSCESLTNLNVSNFDTSKVTNMSSMFDSIKQIGELDISNFDTSNVEHMNHMFHGCTNLKTIYVGNGWNIDKLKSNDAVSYGDKGSYYMFYNSINLVGGSGTTYDQDYIDASYARVDGGTSNPGYLTLKTT